jgi:HEAT repeat protein/predicted Ser/Thr protein kinase
MTCGQCHQGYNVGNWTPGKTVLCPACNVELAPAGSLVGAGAVVTPTRTMHDRPVPQPPPLEPAMPASPESPVDSLSLDGGIGDDLVPQMPDLKEEPATDLKKLIPEEFNGYHVLKEIARGGMGVVLLADQPSLRRKVAMKLMLPSAESNDPRARERFLREARAMARIKHAYIIQVYEIGEIQGMPWFTMEFVEGRTLAELIDDKRIGVNQAVEIHVKVAQALAFAHSQGILHRDLKPGNIMVRHSGDPVLMDFGLVKDVTGESVKLSITGTVLGTPAYMSPEQAQALALDARADVYSLGAVLYEAVTGHVPFEGKTAFATIYQVLHDDPTPARTLNPSVPPDLSRICTKAMEKDPVDRYQTMAEFVQDLEHFLLGEAVAAQGPSLEYRIRQWIKTHRMHCVAGASIAAMLLLVLLLMGSGVLRATPAQKVDIRKTLAEGSNPTRVARIQLLAGDLVDGKIKKGSSEANDARRALEELTGDADPEIAVAALQALLKAAPEETKLDVFGAQTDAPRPKSVREVALDAVVQLQKQGTSMVLAKVMERDPDTELRLQAIRGMGRNVEPSAMTILIRMAVRGQPRAIAEAAREKLKELRSPDSVLSMYAGSRAGEATRALGEMLEKTSDYERQLEEAMEDIPAAKKKAVPKASQPYEVAMLRMKDGDKDQRMTAAYDLGLMARQESEDALRAALEDQDLDVALAAAESLGKIPNLKASGKLIELLDMEKKDRPSVRMAAARACGLVNPSPSGAGIAGALAKERDAGVQVELAQALGRLRPPEAKLPLLALLVEGAMPAKVKAVWAMGQLGDASVCPALVTALEKAGPNDKELKAELAGALSALTGKSLGTDPAKWRAALKK